MIEIATIVVLLVYIFLKEVLDRVERKRMLEMLMAKSLTELKEGEATVAEAKSKTKEETVPDLVLSTEADDVMFQKAIKKELGRDSAVDKLKEKIKSLRKRNG